MESAKAATATGSTSSTPMWRRYSLQNWVLGASVVAFLLWILGSVLLMVFAAALIAVALRGGSEFLSQMTRMPPRLGLAVVTVMLVVVIGVIVVFSGSRLGEQGNQLWEQLSQATAYGRDWLRQYSWGRAIVTGATPQEAMEQGHRLAGGLGIALISVLDALLRFVIVIIAALYFAAAPDLYINGFIRLLPPLQRQRGQQVLSALGDTLRRWLFAQGISMLVIFIVSYAGLALIGVPMALLLALIVGLTNFVPYVGPIVGAVPAVLVGLGESVEMMIWIGVLFASIQFLEGNVLQPLVQKRMTHLPPALTILSQTILGTLFGVIGVILATPVLAFILVTVRMLYIEDALEG